MSSVFDLLYFKKFLLWNKEIIVNLKIMKLLGKIRFFKSKYMR